MKTEEITNYIENIAPPGVAWKDDNVGYQIGSSKVKLKNILLCLELNPKGVYEAIKKDCNLIITHHPLIFKPLKNLNLNNPLTNLIEILIKNDISVYSAHTNLDFSKGGVNTVLANKLGLTNQKFLLDQKDVLFKLVVFVPQNFLSKVSDAVFDSGGGIIGEYSKCSYRLNGKGTFEGSENSNPVIGKKQNFEIVDEVKAEFIVNEWVLAKVINSMKSTHPYEEPAFDVYKLENSSVNYGEGIYGELEKNYTETEFLTLVCNKLKIENLKYCSSGKKNIKTVAVCGGSGASLLNKAIQKRVDAFVTSDIKYHAFQEAEERVLFVDAGHYETEIPIIHELKKTLDKFVKERNEKIKINVFSSTNPVKFYNKRGDK